MKSFYTLAVVEEYGSSKSAQILGLVRSHQLSCPAS